MTIFLHILLFTLLDYKLFFFCCRYKKCMTWFLIHILLAMFVQIFVSVLLTFIYFSWWSLTVFWPYQHSFIFCYDSHTTHTRNSFQFEQICGVTVQFVAWPLCPSCFHTPPVRLAWICFNTFPFFVWTPGLHSWVRWALGEIIKMHPSDIKMS